MKEICIRFFAAVDEYTTRSLFNVIDDVIQNGYEKVHLLMSTPGGSVYHGLSLYNYLVKAPIELITYNFGSVDSIGIILYCAGKIRKSVEHARFLLHPINSHLQANSSMDEKNIDEMLKSLKIDQANISKIISHTINTNAEVGNNTVTEEEINNMIHNRTTLFPTQAKEKGLVHSISDLDAPIDKGIISIFNQPQQNQTHPLIFPQNYQDNISVMQNNYSRPNNNFTPKTF